MHRLLLRRGRDVGVVDVRPTPRGAGAGREPGADLRRTALALRRGRGLRGRVVRGARTACGIRRLGARTAVGDGLFGFGGGAAGIAILSLVFFGVINYTRQARDFQGRVIDTSVAWS